MAKNSKRDILIIFILLLASVATYFIYLQVMKNKVASKANVLYHGEIIVEVDFNLEKVTVIKKQPNTNDMYPIINEELSTITLLGDYEINGVRQLFEITYNFEEKSMQVTYEESPKNIVSLEGKSYGKPLISIPNGIRINFDIGEDIDHEI